MTRAGQSKKAPVSTKHAWTPEKLSALVADKLNGLRQQAVKLNVPDLIAMCDAELAARTEKQAKAKSVASRPNNSGVVTAYHFVCAGNRGVVEEGDGTFRSGSWIVAESVAVESLKHGAVLALHEAKSVPSYRQGSIIGFRRVLRDMVDKENWGLEFHVRPTPEPLTWVGDGAGEKGYRWSKS